MLLFLLVFTAGFVQVTVGFGLGLIIMAGVGLLELMSLSDGAAMVNAIGLFSTGYALYGKHKLMDLKVALKILIGMLPGIIAGYIVLYSLADTASELCKLILGVIILISALALAIKPAQRTQTSGAPRLISFGALAGFLGGFTSTPGPPLVYLFNSEPISFEKAKANLLGLFVITAAFRLVLFLATDEVSTELLATSTKALIAVFLGVGLGKVVKLPLSDTNMRRLSYTLLVILSVPLVLQGL